MNRQACPLGQDHVVDANGHLVDHALDHLIVTLAERNGFFDHGFSLRLPGGPAGYSITPDASSA
jgi:hypothetical protein